MTAATAWPIRFQIGARTLWSVRRQLVRVPLGLSDVLAGMVPVLPPLPPLPPQADGWSITSLPETLLDNVARNGCIAFIRQRYVRYHADVSGDAPGWEATASANARQSLRRKTRRLANAGGGTVDIRRYRAAEDMAAFHAAARSVAALTYQERLLGAGLPDDPAFVRAMTARAAAGEVRGWLLYLRDRPVAYLYCPVSDGTARYDYVGHDPAVSDLSPGTVLMAEALRDLAADPTVRRFDFTEGEGQHKRQFATGGTPCIDLLLLRPTPSNRAIVAALAGFDRAVAVAKHWAALPVAARLADRVRRGRG